MPQPQPARPGDPLARVDTPALILDLDALDRNIAEMAAFGSRQRIAIRPHAKTHKSPDIALLQIAAGAVGQCCQKVSEAEVLVAGGIGDVLVSNEIIGTAKLDRLAALARRARIGSCVDHRDGVDALASAARRANVTIDVLVEIDVGQRRCGVAPGEAAVALARHVQAAPSLRFRGLQAYHGRAQHLRTHAERREAIASAVAAVKTTHLALKSAGIDCPTVSGAGTGTFDLEAASGVYTELQPGSYVFMDADYARNSGADGKPFTRFGHALFVLATVMSTPEAGRAVVDAGHKVLSVDSGMPILRDHAGAVYQRPADEHGVLDLTACNHRPGLGDQVLIIPGHCDPTVNLHDWYVGVRGLAGRNPHVEAIWPVAARGAHF
jgi:D-serine deaminase-like pyridoxal phosphate-dependent protein